MAKKTKVAVAEQVVESNNVEQSNASNGYKLNVSKYCRTALEKIGREASAEDVVALIRSDFPTAEVNMTSLGSTLSMLRTKMYGSSRSGAVKNTSNSGGVSLEQFQKTKATLRSRGITAEEASGELETVLAMSEDAGGMDNYRQILAAMMEDAAS